MILTHLQKLPKNVGDLGKLIVAKGLKKLPKVKKIVQSGHTDCRDETRQEWSSYLGKIDGFRPFDHPVLDKIKDQTVTQTKAQNVRQPVPCEEISLQYNALLNED